jgi:predicted metal-dependent hydrolase
VGNVLKHRKPNFDFSGVPAQWSRNLEFAHTFTAGSTGAPAVEPYLNRVLADSKRLLPEKYKHLEREIDLFIKQETAHYQIHRKYNEQIYKAYPFLRGMEKAKADDYARFLATKSHRFNLAYSAAFETLALSMALFLFGKADDLLEGADTRTLELWKWHLAEEYEHRAVCYDVYNAVYGDYFYRCYVVIFAFLHLAKHNKKAVAALLAEDRKKMSPAEVEESIKRHKAFRRRFMGFHLPRILKLLTPWYNPSKVPPPPGLEATLAQYDPVPARN